MFLFLPMLLELQETLQHPKFAQRLTGQGETAVSMTARFRAACHEAPPAHIVPPAKLRDPDDIHGLACAVSAGADAIVTGGKDLLELESFEGITIITAAEALKRLGLGSMSISHGSGPGHGQFARIFIQLRDQSLINRSGMRIAKFTQYQKQLKTHEY